MVEPMKEAFAFKEAIASPYKKQFAEVIEIEMKNFRIFKFVCELIFSYLKSNVKK